MTEVERLLTTISDQLQQISEKLTDVNEELNFIGKATFAKRVVTALDDLNKRIKNLTP